MRILKVLRRMLSNGVQKPSKDRGPITGQTATDTNGASAEQTRPLQSDQEVSESVREDAL